MTAKPIGSGRHVNCYLAAWLGRERGVIGATAAIPASLHPTETSCCFRSVSDQLTQLANALFLLGGQGEGRPGILLGNIQTSADPAPSPQGRADHAIMRTPVIRRESRFVGQSRPTHKGMSGLA